MNANQRDYSDFNSNIDNSMHYLKVLSTPKLNNSSFFRQDTSPHEEALLNKKNREQNFELNGQDRLIFQNPSNSPLMKARNLKIKTELSYNEASLNSQLEAQANKKNREQQVNIFSN